MTIVRSATTAPRAPVPNTPPMAMPMPANAAAYRPSDERARRPASATSPPGDRGADGDADRRERVTTRRCRAARRRRPDATQRAGRAASPAATRGGRTSRPRPSADERRRGEPGEDQPELDEHELQEAADGAMSTFGKIASRRCMKSGRVVELVDERLAGAGDHEPEEAEADAPGERRRQALAEGPAGRARAGPTRARGRLGVGIALVAPMSRRDERLDADREEHDVDDRDEQQRRPVVQARRAGCGWSSSRTTSGSRTARARGSRTGSR